MGLSFQEIQDEFAQDCKFDPLQLDVEALKGPELHCKYAKMYHDARLSIRRLRSEYATLRRDKWEFYSGRLDPSIEKERGWKPFPLKVIRQDMDIYMDADQDLQTLLAKIEYCEEKVKLLEGIMKVIGARQWDIKNAIEWRKWINGAQ